MASPSANRKITRQFARTVTAQKPFNSPLAGEGGSRASHIRRHGRSIETREDIAKLFRVLTVNAAAVVILIKAFQPLCAGSTGS